MTDSIALMMKQQAVMTNTEITAKYLWETAVYEGWMVVAEMIRGINLYLAAEDEETLEDFDLLHEVALYHWNQERLQKKAS